MVEVIKFGNQGEGKVIIPLWQIMIYAQ